MLSTVLKPGYESGCLCDLSTVGNGSGGLGKTYFYSMCGAGAARGGRAGTSCFTPRARDAHARGRGHPQAPFSLPYHTRMYWYLLVYSSTKAHSKVVCLARSPTARALFLLGSAAEDAAEDAAEGELAGAVGGDGAGRKLLSPALRSPVFFCHFFFV